MRRRRFIPLCFFSISFLLSTVAFLICSLLAFLTIALSLSLEFTTMHLHYHYRAASEILILISAKEKTNRWRSFCPLFDLTLPTLVSLPCSFPTAKRTRSVSHSTGTARQQLRCVRCSRGATSRDVNARLNSSTNSEIVLILILTR